LLTAVGFGSPPAWVRPYAVLSRGEQFRCDLARALAAVYEAPDERSPALPLVAFDEFTSVVDRTVARLGSAAVAKAIRGGRVACRFVAVTCHYDVAEWLEPDWVVDMATRTCQRRRLRRPAIELELCRAKRAVWRVFAPHHYLSGALSARARCYVALWRGTPVTFIAMLPLIGRRKHWRISRIVTLPDFQGVGIGTRAAESLCELYRQAGQRINVTASHPALIAHCKRSPLWRTVRVLKHGSATARKFIHNYRSSAGRAVVSFEYLGSRT
jgi:GNAT superfamily N-acetyltransferase